MNMNVMENKLDVLLHSKSTRPRLMTHLIAGFPTLDESLEIGRALVKGGSSILEVQIPFSDPVADGPSIIGACQTALKNKVHVDDVFKLIRTFSSESDTPIVIVSYANPVYRYGIKRFVEAAHAAGASGIIIPDMPIDSEEGKELVLACRATGMHPIILVSPGVPQDRLRELAKSASGFVYTTSRQGITGATSVFATELPQFLEQLHTIFSLPIAIGFGVKSKSDVQSLSALCEIVVAGSVFVNEIQKSENIQQSARAVEKLARELAG